jgi:hypothetical protein
VTFCPASSGACNILTNASRAAFACRLHMPGRPLISICQQVEAHLVTDLGHDDTLRAHPQVTACTSCRSETSLVLRVSPAGSATHHGEPADRNPIYFALPA